MCVALDIAFDTTYTPFYYLLLILNQNLGYHLIASCTLNKCQINNYVINVIF